MQFVGDGAKVFKYEYTMIYSNVCGYGGIYVYSAASKTPNVYLYKNWEVISKIQITYLNCQL